MGKRKIFTKTDISIAQVEHNRDMADNVVITPALILPMNTKVEFGRNAASGRSFDFARWYGVGINPITYA